MVEAWGEFEGVDRQLDIHVALEAAAPGGIRTTEAFSSTAVWDSADTDTEKGCIRSVATPYSADGGLAVLRGNLAPDGAIVKTAANPVLLSLYENLIDAIGENIRFNFVTDTHGADAHDVLIEAIVAGNDRRAVEETTEYLSGLVPEA